MLFFSQHLKFVINCQVITFHVMCFMWLLK